MTISCPDREVCTHSCEFNAGGRCFRVRLGYAPRLGVYPDNKCLVAELCDTNVGVLVVGDAGLAMLVSPADQDTWRFTIWPDTAARDLFAVRRPPPG